MFELIEGLRPIAINSAYNASRALSKWLKRGVRLSSDGFKSIPITEAAESAGPPDEAVVAVHMALVGDLDGDILLAFPEDVAFGLVDMLMGTKPGTTCQLGELEQSCLQETGNIVASSLTNSLSNWLKLRTSPGVPTVVHDLAGAVVQPLLVQHAAAGDTVFSANTEFEIDAEQMGFALLLLPTVDAMNVMRRRCRSDRVRQNALHTIAINGAFDASRAMSKWLRRGVRLSTEGFTRIPLSDICRDRAEPDEPVVALHTQLCQQLHGHALVMMSSRTARLLTDILMQQEAGTTSELDEMALSCLQETGNIISASFVNSWAKWLDIHSEPAPPRVIIDHAESILQAMVAEQAIASDDVFMSRSSFSVDGQRLEWDFFLLPSPASLRLIEASCG